MNPKQCMQTLLFNENSMFCHGLGTKAAFVHTKTNESETLYANNIFNLEQSIHFPTDLAECSFYGIRRNVPFFFLNVSNYKKKKN